MCELVPPPIPLTYSLPHAASRATQVRKSTSASLLHRYVILELSSCLLLCSVIACYFFIFLNRLFTNRTTTEYIYVKFLWIWIHNWMRLETALRWRGRSISWRGVERQPISELVSSCQQVRPVRVYARGCRGDWGRSRCRRLPLYWLADITPCTVQAMHCTIWPIAIHCGVVIATFHAQ